MQRRSEENNNSEEGVLPSSENSASAMSENSESESAEVTPVNLSVEKERVYLTGTPFVLTLTSLTLVTFLLLLDVSIVSTAIPKITSDFHSLNDVGWYGSAYLLTNCALQPLTGKIYTQLSSKWVYLSFFALFELGSLLCGAATSSSMLIIGRAISGLGASGLLNGAYTIVNAVLPLHKQPKYVGFLLGVSQLGLLGGPLIGGALTEYASWRWCFYINLPVGGVVAILLLSISLPDHVSKKAGTQTVLTTLKNLDLVGFGLFAPTIIQLLLALQWGGTRFGWNSPTTIGLLCGSVGTLLVFLVWEYRMGNEAMIPLSIVKNRPIWSSCLNYFCFWGCMIIATYYLPIYFQAVQNASPTVSGVHLLPTIVSTIIFAVVGGNLVGRVGYYLPFAVISGVLTAVGSGLLGTFTPTTATGIWIGYQILAASGRGLGLQVPVIAAQNNCSQADLPVVTALVVFSQNLGGAIFLSLAQVIFSSRLRSHLERFAPDVNSESVIIAGATDFRGIVLIEYLDGVLVAYSKAYDEVMYLAAGAACGAFLFAFGMGWKSVKKAKVKTVEEPKQGV